MRISRKWRRAEGFTLIEMVIASAVFAVGMLGILKLLHLTVVANRYAADLSTANAILQKQIEMVTREAFNNVVNGTAGGSVFFYDDGSNGDVTSNDGIYTRQFTQNNKLYTCTLQRQTDTPRTDIEQITGTLSWTDMGGAAANTLQQTRTISFITYKNMI